MKYHEVGSFFCQNLGSENISANGPQIHTGTGIKGGGGFVRRGDDWRPGVAASARGGTGHNGLSCRLVRANCAPPRAWANSKWLTSVGFFSRPEIPALWRAPETAEMVLI